MDPNALVTTPPRKPWPRAWTWAILLAVSLAVAYSTNRWWFTALLQALFGHVPASFSEVTPGLAWVLIAWLILALAGGVAVGLLIVEGLSARGRHRWQQEEAERRRQWDRERQEEQRLAQIRDQLWLESLPPESRERIVAQRRESAELEQRARALLEAERQGRVNGEGR
jgi:hypothetical protein